MNCFRRAVIASALALLVGGLPTEGESAPPVSESLGYAISGYDVVAYHAAGTAQQGRVEHSFKWRDATWLFASADNRAKFAANPELYAPQYGGHCALAMTDGKKSRGDPLAWTMHKGKLYLNGGKEVRDRWMMGTSANISKADSWWERLYAKQ